ncbi:hypothetical protein ACFVW2_22385 [Streptomyces sp. NPDC058171]
MRTSSALLAVTTLSLALVACGTDTSGGSGNNRSSTAADAGSSAPASASKQALPKPGPDGSYEQTWKRPTADTTCDQFRQQMTSPERWVMAAEILTDQRDEGADEPARPDVTRFEADLGVACQDGAVADSVMTEVGSTLYRLDPSYQS